MPECGGELWHWQRDCRSSSWCTWRFSGYYVGNAQVQLHQLLVGYVLLQSHSVSTQPNSLPCSMDMRSYYVSPYGGAIIPSQVQSFMLLALHRKLNCRPLLLYVYLSPRTANQIVNFFLGGGGVGVMFRSPNRHRFSVRRWRLKFNLQAPCVLILGQAFRYSPENGFLYI